MKKIGAFVLFLTVAFYSNAQEWKTVGNVQLSDNEITCLKTFQDSLYIGAAISEVNGTEGVGVLLWDSISIMPVSSGFGVPRDIDFFESDLYVVGSFSNFAEVESTIGIAVWQNNAWASVGGGGVSLSDNPDECENFEGKLYISHEFQYMGAIIGANGFAAWDGNEWSAQESVYGFDLGPRVMCVFDGYLWGGGDIDFTTEDVPINNIARFDGEHWYDVNGGMSGTVQAFYPDEEEGRLYAAGNGSLAQFGDVSCPNNVVFWDGENWNPLGVYNDINYDVKALTKYRGQIYAGGFFQLNGVTEKLAYFDGVHWRALPGAGTIDGAVDALEVYKDELYIGGTFTQIGGLEVPGLVRYYLHPDSVQWGVEDTTFINETSKEFDFDLYPNPASSFVKIEFLIPQTGEIVLSDIQGRKLLSQMLYGNKVFEMDLTGIAHGSYQVALYVEGRFMKSKKLLLQGQ